MELPHLGEQGRGVPLFRDQLVEPHEVADELAQLRARRDLDRPLSDDEQAAPAHPPERGAQPLAVDETSADPDYLIVEVTDDQRR